MRKCPRVYIWIISFAIATSILQHSTSYAQCTGLCGDANASGSITLADWVPIMKWMWFGVTPAGSVACADVDGYQDVTVRDAHMFVRCIFLCDPPEAFFNCNAPLPPLVPEATDAVSIYYSSEFPAGDSVALVSLRLDAEESLSGLTLPLRVSLNGSIPEIEVIQTDPNDVWDFDTSNTVQPAVGVGEVLLGFMNLSWLYYGNDDPLAILRITAPPAAGDRVIFMEYANLPPSNVAMALNSDGDFGGALQPRLFPCGVEVFGDADGSGAVSASDIILTVGWIFKQQAGPPTPCEAAADANCTGTVTAADVIYLVNYIFKSARAPCNVCELVGNGTWICP